MLRPPRGRRGHPRPGGRLRRGRSAASRVALVERGDFGGGLSFNHQRTVHGGLRSLQSFDVGRARESIHERRALARIAPHLLRPMPFLMGTYRSLTRGRARAARGLPARRLPGAPPQPRHRAGAAPAGRAAGVARRVHAPLPRHPHREPDGRGHVVRLPDGRAAPPDAGLRARRRRARRGPREPRRGARGAPRRRPRRRHARARPPDRRRLRRARPRHAERGGLLAPAV